MAAAEAVGGSRRPAVSPTISRSLAHGVRIAGCGDRRPRPRVKGRLWGVPARPPRVSILLATRRPELLPYCLAAVARLTYPRLVLVLVLHGAGYMTVLHGDGHTWKATDDHSLKDNDGISPGWNPALTGIEDPNPSHPLLAHARAACVTAA